MKILEIILEAKPDNLGQGLLDKIFAVYQKRDINDQTIPKFSNGLEIANHMFKFSGPQKLIWTAKQYTIDQHFFLHDLANWKNIFDLFDRPDIKQRLEQKDINQYKSIDELKSVILPLVQQRENMTAFDHILESVDKFAQKGEAEWLYRGPSYSIYHPITFYSSNVMLDLYGGKDHVDVCTVTGKTLFEDYSEYGYVIYTLTKDNFFVAYINQTETINSEFSDKTNNHTSYDLLYQIKHFPELKIVINKVTNEYTNLDVLITLEENKENQYALSKIAVKKNGFNLRFVPRSIRDYELYRLAVKSSGGSLKYVPYESRDYELCKMAVSNDGNAILYVPMNFTKQEYHQLSKLAVQQDALAILSIPNDLLDYSICKIVVSIDGLLLEHVPRELRDYSLCEVAIKNNSWAFKYVPYELRDYEMCKIVVSDRASAIYDVPKELRDKIKQELGLNNGQ